MGDHDIQLVRLARLTLVVSLAFSSCYIVPTPDPRLTEYSHDMAGEVAAALGTAPRKLPAAWTNNIEPDGGNYVERDANGAETYRLIMIRKDVPYRALRAVMAHELAHAHLEGQKLDPLSEEGICNLVAVRLDPAWGAEEIAAWRYMLANTDLDLAWARSITREQLRRLPDEQQLTFYGLAYFHAKETYGDAYSVGEPHSVEMSALSPGEWNSGVSVSIPLR